MLLGVGGLDRPLVDLLRAEAGQLFLALPHHRGDLEGGDVLAQEVLQFLDRQRLSRMRVIDCGRDFTEAFVGQAATLLPKDF